LFAPRRPPGGPPPAPRAGAPGERAVMAGLGAGTAGLLALGATAGADGGVAAALAVAGYGLVYLGLGAAGPSENDLLHRRVDSGGRATALSVQSLAQQILGAAAGLVIGVLPLGPLPWLLGAVVLLGGTLLWTRRAPAVPVPSPE
ncbi:MFS transporter, partial [Streptomyces sp. NPDC059446]